MDVSTAEKEWLLKMNGNKAVKADEKPAPVRGGSASKGAPEVKGKTGNGFADIAGMDELKRFITEGFVNVLNNKECAAAYGITPPSILFYGPTGCGKTFFAEKLAEEVGINFMKVVPDDIASTLVHGTQEKIGEVFRKAERKAPTLLFFDEFDAMVPRRTEIDNNCQNGEVNEFLCMLNNATERGVYVLAATNHPERIDKAVLRKGRIDEMIYVDMPDIAARMSLFKLALSKLPADEGIDYERLATLTAGYNCSDITYIVKTASRQMFNASIKDRTLPYKKITQELLEVTISQKSPSVNSRDLREYERIRDEFAPNESRKSASIGFR